MGSMRSIAWSLLLGVLHGALHGGVWSIAWGLHGVCMGEHCMGNGALHAACLI